MSKAPGYVKHPDHRIVEKRVGELLRVEFGGELIAESDDVIVVTEDGHPVRYYFPRSGVRMETLEPSGTTTRCPFKGTASYFSLTAGGKRLEDAVWSYEDPFDEHVGLKGRLAFYDDKYPEIRIIPRVS